MNKIIVQPPIVKAVMKHLSPISYINFYRMCRFMFDRPQYYDKPVDFCIAAAIEYLAQVAVKVSGGWKDGRKYAENVLKEIRRDKGTFLTDTALLDILMGTRHFQHLYPTLCKLTGADAEQEEETADVIVWYYDDNLRAVTLRKTFPFFANILSLTQLRLFNIHCILKMSCTIDLFKYMTFRANTFNTQTRMLIREKLMQCHVAGLDVTIIYDRNLEKRCPTTVTTMEHMSKREVSDIMGTAYPESCVFTFECKCDTFYNHRQFCQNKQKCGCEHCKDFYSRFLTEYNKRLNAERIKIWLAFWDPILVLVDPEMNLYRWKVPPKPVFYSDARVSD